MVKVWPDLLSASAQDQDTEDKQHGEPDLADHCGVALHFIQQAAQKIPFTHFSRQLSCFLCDEVNTKNNPLWLTDRPCSLIQSPLKVSLHYLRRIHIISGWLKENFISRTPWFDLLFVILQWYRRWYRNRCGCKSQNRATLWQGQTLSFLAEFADRSHGCWFQVSKTYLSAGNQDLNLG